MHRLALVWRVSRDIDERFDLFVVSRFRDHSTSPRMADQDDRTFRVPDCPLGRGNIVVQRVEWVLDRNNLESGLFEIRDDLLPARPVRERTMDKDRGLGFQLGSRSWRADRNHRGQQEAQAHNAFVRFHSYVPSFGGDLGVAIFTVDTNQSNAAGSSPKPTLQFFDEDGLDV